MNKLSPGRYIWRNGDFIPVEEKTRSGPQMVTDIPGYLSPLGPKSHWVEGRRARREDMKIHNVREVDPSERPQGAGISKTKEQAAAERAQLEARPKYTMSPQLKERLMKGY